ncbi:efflux RND transporter periplasmic adaptor subunit [Lacipirellula sp.]|uniref:efflux RND transporter periplasmic adaptor subunit n=1 Tax=Lacipirellula sp. TaxID=2691419 RepID=UPI003D11E135
MKPSVAAGQRPAGATHGRFRPMCVLLTLLTAIAIGCTPPVAERTEPIRPVKTMVIAAGGDVRTRIFPGVAEAARRVELAFQVPGVLVKFPVKEGQRVAKGEVIGELRQDEFQARLTQLQGELDQARAVLRRLQSGERPEETLRRESQVRAAAARMANARAEYGRFEQLVRNSAVSRSQYEIAETAYQVAQEEYQAAVQLLEKGAIGREEDIDAQAATVRGLEGRVVEAALQLSDATLVAPYDGVIAQRFVEEGQNVRAKEPIVRFQDVEEIEVVVDVPETVMAADIRTADVIDLQAEFSGAPGLRFPVEIREIAQVADPTTQTFKVRTAMQAPTDVTILPGMTATVTADFRRASVLGDRLLVPVSAVVKKDAGDQIVWVIEDDGDAHKVAKRVVKLGDATGGDIEIVAGLAPGDRIAIAGASRLRDGMQVRDLGDQLGDAQ